MNEKYQELRKRINHYVPDLLELRFGCEVVRNGLHYIYLKEIIAPAGGKHWLVRGGYAPGPLSSIAGGNEWFESASELRGYSFEVLGIPPTLEHVLRAIELSRGSRYIAQEVGHLLGFETGDGEMYWEPNRS